MSDPLWVFLDPPLSGPENMARDEVLLHSGRYRPAALRVYFWSPATISLGYFQRFSAVAELPGDVRDLPVVRRLTGGGAILHDQEITYCLVAGHELPAARQAPVVLYGVVHEAWRAVLAADGQPSELAPESYPMPSPRSGPFFCFEKPGKTDLIVGDEKLLGSAQRRTADRVLQHGSLLLSRRYGSHPGADIGMTDTTRRDRWIARFVELVAQAVDLTPRAASFDEQDAAAIAEYRERYASDVWTRRR